MAKKVNGKGLRFNKDKVELNLCPTSTKAAISKVLMANSDKHGGKYPNDNWRKGMSWVSIIDCLERHLECFKNGIDIDHTDGTKHIWKVLTNAAFLAEYDVTCPELDDRYKGKTATLEDFSSDTVAEIKDTTDDTDDGKYLPIYCNDIYDPRD